MNDKKQRPLPAYIGCGLDVVIKEKLHKVSLVSVFSVCASVRLLGICVLEWVIYFFFFSSRRRHTRYWRDWSSDVCSSDLAGTIADEHVGAQAEALRGAGELDAGPRGVALQEHGAARHATTSARVRRRSEERRVGKECRSRWSPYH